MSTTVNVHTRGMALSRPRVARATIVLGAAAVSTLFALQSMRVLVSYLVVVVGQANRTALARDTVAVFAAIVLAPLVIRLFGLRMTIVATAAIAAIVRIVLQFWTDPDARLIVAGAIIVLWGWMFVALLDVDRASLALGIVSGFILDVAVRAGFMTLDLPWNSGLPAETVTVVLALILLMFAGAIWSMTTVERVPHRSGIALIGVGPGIAMFYLVGGNLGLAQVKTGLAFGPALALLAIGLAVGAIGSTLIFAQVPHLSSAKRIPLQAGVVMIGAISLWLFWTSQALAPYMLPIVTATNMILVTSTMQADERPSRGGVSIAPGVWFTIGMLLQVAILFYYYDASGKPLYMAIAAVILALASITGTLINREPSTAPNNRTQPLGLIAMVVVLLAIVCVWRGFATNEPASATTLPGTFTVMTYNIQDGFAADNSFDLEAQAETIAAAQPDVVVLQEVSRGWLVTSGTDEALWLSHRLDMPIYFGGNSDDGLWGNAILTRGKVTDVQQHHFSVTKNLKRGSIDVQVTTENGPVWVIGTHLDNPRAADAIRLEQTRQLIQNIDPSAAAIIMGDFNADPETAVLTSFNDAGFTDSGGTFLRDTYTTTDQRRLDYILTSSEVRVDSMRAIESQASDHKPVVANVTLVR